MIGSVPRLVVVVFLLFSLFIPPNPPFPGRVEHARTTGDPIEAIYAKFDTIHTPLDEYVWPTDATRIITSTFGEFRRTHFHAGIDISTHNATGYRVFAARDGYVWRVGISPGGYGKILLIRHSDGFVTAYAHLKAFSDPISELVRREQMRLEQFPLDLELEPDAVPVKQGEIVAYSGASGSGPAHLHFEIRDENLNPLNPLILENMNVADELAPVIRTIAVVPIGPNSSVAAHNRPLILRSFRRGADTARLREKVRIRGKVGIEVNTRDRVDGTYHPMGVYRLQLFVDGALKFAARLDRLKEEESKQILLFYDLSFMRRRIGRYQKLYVEEGASLPIFERFPQGAGIIDADSMPEGEHVFRVVCMDISGNATELTGTLVAERSGALVQPAVVQGESMADELPADIFTIAPDHAGWFSFDKDSLQVVYDSGAVFAPANVRVAKNSSGGATFYSFEPRDVLMNKGVRVFVYRGRAAKAALYWRGRSWEFTPTNFDTSTGYLSAAMTFMFGDVAVFEDNTPPGIGGLRIQTRNKRVSVRFSVYDNRSGVDAKEIKTYIDDRFVIPEISGWRVRCDSPEALEKGRHTLRIVAQDNMSNTVSLARNFIVN